MAPRWELLQDGSVILVCLAVFAWILEWGCP
jgi:hypothetical protein